MAEHPIRDVLIQAGYKLVDTGEFWKTAALYRSGRNPTSLSINKRTGRFWDFSAGVNNKSAEDLVKLINGQKVDFSAYTPEPVQEKIKLVKYYPKDVLKKLLPDFGFLVSKRGLLKETLEMFEAGLAHSGKLNRRICFPIYDQQGRIVGFSGRWYKEDLPPQSEFKIAKWKHHGQKRDWLYPCHLNENIIREKREVIILESIGDLLSLWQAGIQTGTVIFGTTLSSKQLNYIIGLDPLRIIIATNNDTAIENTHEQEQKGPAAAKRIAKKLDKLFNPEKIVISLPPMKDFGPMTPEEIQTWYNKTINNVQSSR